MAIRNLIPLLLALTFSLAGAQNLFGYTVQARVTVKGVRVIYAVAPAGKLGRPGSSTNTPFGCLVLIDPNFVHAANVAHELGHCLDQGYSRSFGSAGCRIREYACDPAEGYADTFALAYIFTQGQDLAPLGWTGQADDTRLPDPAQITPQFLSDLFR